MTFEDTVWNARCYFLEKPLKHWVQFNFSERIKKNTTNSRSSHENLLKMLQQQLRMSAKWHYSNTRVWLEAMKNNEGEAVTQRTWRALLKHWNWHWDSKRRKFWSLWPKFLVFSTERKLRHLGSAPQWHANRTIWRHPQSFSHVYTKYDVPYGHKTPLVYMRLTQEIVENYLRAKNLEGTDGCL